MKAKNLLFGVLMAVAGAMIALGVYSHIVGTPKVIYSTEDGTQREISKANAILASFQSQPGQVDFTYAAEQTVHAVVNVSTKSIVRSRQSSNPFYDWFYGDQGSRQREVNGVGSGVIITSDGYIITNNHVIENADQIVVKLNDNREFDAEIVGKDPTTDLAVIKIDAKGLDYIEYGNSDDLKVGEWVLAVGNPFNLTSTVTAGIVSAKGRNIGILDENYSVESFIQTDVALNPGNSGGALVDTKGNLVGINSAIYSPSGAYAGASFAIPVSIVKKVVEDLIEYGEVQKALLGVSISPVTAEDAKTLKLPEVKGVKIEEIMESGAAKSSDLKKNDVIVKVNNANIASVGELQEQIGKYRPGDRVTITYYRDGKLATTQMTLKNVNGNTDVVKPGMGTTSATVMGAKMESLSREELAAYNTSNGVKLTEVGSGKLKDMGLTAGTIIVSVNGKKVNSANDVKQATNNGEDLKTIEGIQANGLYFSYRLNN